MDSNTQSTHFYSPAPLLAIMYFTFFGLSYLASSTLYFVNLQKFGSDTNCTGLLTITDTNPPPSSSEINLPSPCHYMYAWESYSIIGIIYGSIFLLTTLSILWRILWSHFQVRVRSMSPLKSTLSTAMGAAIGNEAHWSFVEKRRIVQEKRFWTWCTQPDPTSPYFLLILGFWLVSFLIPAFLAVNLVKTGGFFGDQTSPYILPAWTLFTICTINFIIVCISCAFVCTDNKYEPEKSKMSQRRRESSKEDTSVIFEPL